MQILVYKTAWMFKQELGTIESTSADPTDPGSLCSVDITRQALASTAEPYTNRHVGSLNQNEPLVFDYAPLFFKACGKIFLFVVHDPRIEWLLWGYLRSGYLLSLPALVPCCSLVPCPPVEFFIALTCSTRECTYRAVASFRSVIM